MAINFLQQRIDATKAQIVAYENASLDIGSEAIESYDLDTGQTRTRVTSANIDILQNVLDSLYNRVTTLEARQSGSGTVVVNGGW